ncbi:DNA polymerase III subunit chi [Cypionkella aquatica]|uniref:DNA polymerase III subunit chi n=2 Tax=Cypionkella aquatica TaxID=1756042 RepID=A0AA37TXC7_9RHOB|nr:DNA polymerase III subunit chi [Cypionkella aquatica]
MFYHLTRSTPQATMATILPRALSAGWKVMLRGTDLEALQNLDTALWTDRDDSFLPHGLAGGPHDAMQPILLGQGAIGNAAEGLMLVDGAETTPAEAANLQRVWVLFDGADDVALAGARRLWTALTTAGLAAQYWSEESGRWEKKTEKAAR